MRYWALLGIVLLATLLQTTVAGYVAIAGVAPNLLLAVVASLGLLFGAGIGLSAGVAGGLLVDVLFGHFIGMETLLLGAAGWACGQVEERVFKDTVLLPLLAGVVTTLGTELATMAILSFFGWPVPLLATLRHTVLPAALYNAVITAAVYLRLYAHYEYLRPDPHGQISLR